MHTKPVRTGVGVDGARDRRAVSVLDAEGALLAGAGGGRSGVVLVFPLAGGARACGRWDPEVCGTG